MNQVMLIDDEPALRHSLGQTLELEEMQVSPFASAREALARLTPDWPGVVISDINMPGMDGIAFLTAALARDPELPVILLTSHGDISTAVSAMRLGAYDFIEKPFGTDELLEVVRRAQEKRRLVLENRELREELEAQSGPGPRLLGRTEGIRRLRKILTRIKDAPADVLIHGETGCGKELVARFLHDHSVRAAAPFVAINCGAIPESMMESELFGHEAGAFTGALKRRVGRIAWANGGTLFLDEIESMPMSLQIKLLRVLEERRVEPLGANQGIPLDIRVLAATKADLRQLADRGHFRADLYYRLNVVRVEIPPLRERKEDIPLLFENFLRVAATRYQLAPPRLGPEQVAWLLAHDWPGNVRELRNLAERCVLMGEEGAFADVSLSSHPLTLAEQVERFERTLLTDALGRHGGRLKEVQESLGLARKTLYGKMRKYALDKQDYKTGEEPPAANP
ncbi:sigma-54-dependent transcriptional regulator [Aeromonas schubertii]|uniref:C4-dicarboxylate ABC transporter n=1 Tax=Aeromonas schubertii TaxID=652 RepID=A0A0S2SEF5_9GAMM|nr:sigma-54 dependent transcriptional regulator [Aeromonas schubertii]ALP40089.1 C4-dicarboxylate ABC transporter [Aeromonas schubertii]